MAKTKTRKKVKSINKIWDKRKKELKIKDFTNLDLEGLDLSVIPAPSWNGCIFKNTSVKNTGIKLMLLSLTSNDYFSYVAINGGKYEETIICDCDFSENNLARYNDDVRFTYFRNCNFRNTNLNQFIQGESNLLDEGCVFYKTVFYYPVIDVLTIEKNQQLQLEKRHIIWAIQSIVNDQSINTPYTILRTKIESLSTHDIEKRVLEGEKYLHIDRTGELQQLYNNLDMNLIQKLYFFNGYVVDKKLCEVNLKGFSSNLLNAFSFINCDFRGASLTNSYEDLVSLHVQTFPKSTNNIYEGLVLPNVNYSSWKETPKGHSNKISESPYTFRTNLYLELGRACNAKCTFCRNSSFDACNYNIDNISSTLNACYYYLDNIVIGGGEPTLRKNDIRKLIDEIYHYGRGYHPNWAIFTNGSDLDFKELNRNIYFNISRHAVNDSDNARIFGLSENNIASTTDLMHFVDEKDPEHVTLCATCFKGGLDSYEKIIEYINFCRNIGVQNVLISDLHKDSSLGENEQFNCNLNIDPTVFVKVISYLENIGFSKNYPIYSTGGYVSTVLKNHYFTIAFKNYITKQELEEKWFNAVKRTFDLSIDPEGNLYENWHQSSGIVRSLRKKD